MAFTRAKKTKQKPLPQQDVQQQTFCKGKASNLTNPEPLHNWNQKVHHSLPLPLPSPGRKGWGKMTMFSSNLPLG